MPASVGIVPCLVNFGDVDEAQVEVTDRDIIPASGSSGVSLVWIAGGVGTASAFGDPWAVVLVRGRSGGGGTGLVDPQLPGQVLLRSNPHAWVSVFPKLHP